MTSTNSQQNLNQIYVIDIETNVQENQRNSIRSTTTSHHAPSRRQGQPINSTSVTSKIDSNPEKSSVADGLLGIVHVAGVTFSTLAITWWPQHNVVSFPEFWYEPVPLFPIFSVFIAGYLFWDIKVLFNNQEFSTSNSFSILYFICLLGQWIAFALIYCIWTKYYGYPHPMPLYGGILHLINWFLIYPLAIWMMFPSNLKRRGSTCRKKVFSFIVFNVLRTLLTLGYTSIPSLPIVTNKNWQWTLGILFPLLKMMNTWWSKKFTRWVFDSDEEMTTTENIITIGAQHTLVLTVVLSSSQIEKWIPFILIFFDSLMNFLAYRNIIRLHQAGTPAANELRNRCLKYLALKEYLEFLVPSAFILSFVGSYMGPNYEIIGGMGSDLWHHEKTNNLIEKLQNIVVFMSMEMLRGIGFAIALKHRYGLSLYTGCGYIIRKFGWFIFFSVALAYQLVNSHYPTSTFQRKFQKTLLDAF